MFLEQMGRTTLTVRPLCAGALPIPGLKICLGQRLTIFTNPTVSPFPKVKQRPEISFSLKTPIKAEHPFLMSVSMQETA